ncbi:hypothetical protein QTP88_028802 [Uroleucon formosanum]
MENSTIKKKATVNSIQNSKNVNVQKTNAHNYLSPSTSRQNLIPHKEIQVWNQDLQRNLVGDSFENYFLPLLPETIMYDCCDSYNLKLPYPIIWMIRITMMIIMFLMVEELLMLTTF